MESVNVLQKPDQLIDQQTKKQNSRKINQRLIPRVMVGPPKHPITKWLMAINKKYDVNKDFRFKLTRSKGGPAPIGDGRYVNIPPRKRNIRSERELAIKVCRELFITYLNVFPFDDHVPFEVELSSWALARYGNMLREYEQGYDAQGVYRHGRISCDIFYGALKDLALAGYIAPLTSRVEEGERKGYFKPTRIYLTRLFFESMGLDIKEVRDKQKAYKKRLLETRKWEDECRKQANRLAKRLKRANLDDMKTHERDRLLAQIERCRRTVSTPVAELERFRSKIRYANKRDIENGNGTSEPRSVEQLMIKATVFDPLTEKEKLLQSELQTLRAACYQLIEDRQIHPPAQQVLDLQAEEMAEAEMPGAVSKCEKLQWDIAKHYHLLALYDDWNMSPSPPTKR